MPTARCPRCKKATKRKDNPFRPFCSERCKMIDLGKWASGEYRVKGAPVDVGDGELIPPSEEEESE